MAINLLTDIAIKKLKPLEVPKKYSDGGGLFLIVQPYGTKSWIFRGKLKGKDLTLGLGIYDDVSLAEARDAASDARKKIRSGLHPKQEKIEEAAERKTPTFGEVAESFMAAKDQECAEVTARHRRRILEHHVYPHWEHVKINSIETSDVGDLLVKIEKKAMESGAKINKAGTSIARDKIYGYLKSIFEYSIAFEYIKSSPVDPAVKLRLRRHITKSFKSMDVQKLPDFMIALDEYRAYPVVKAMLKFVMLSGVRTGEARDLKWEFIDMDKGIITIPPEYHKTGRAMINAGKQNAPIRIIPMSRQLKQILERMQSETGKYDLVFPQYNNYKKQASDGVLRMALKRMGFKADQDGHGFRSLLRSEMRLRRADKDCLELIIGHEIARNDVEKIYQRGMEFAFLDERLLILQEWADFLDQAKVLKDEEWMKYVEEGRKLRML